MHLYRVGAGVGGREYGANASAMLETDIPNPARLMSGRFGGCRDFGLRAIRHLNRKRAVVEQHVFLTNEGYLEVLAQKDTAESAAIDKEVAGYGALIGHERFDVTVFT